MAKVFNPSEDGIEQRLADKTLRCVGGATIQLIGRDQETPIIEVEGPLLTDSHVGFKVSGVISTAQGFKCMHAELEMRKKRLNECFHLTFVSSIYGVVKVNYEQKENNELFFFLL